MIQDLSVAPQIAARQYILSISRSSPGVTATAYLSGVEADSSKPYDFRPGVPPSDVEDANSLVALFHQIEQTVDTFGWGFSLGVRDDVSTSYFDDPDLGCFLRCLPTAIERPVSAEENIYAKYCSIEEVHAIYVQHLPEVYKVFVLLRQDHFDEGLMDNLLDREAEILVLHPNELFHFHYMPLDDIGRPRPVPRNAVLILYR